MKLSKWLTVSYDLKFTQFGKNRPFRYDKAYTTQCKNLGEGKEIIQAKGVHTETEFGNDHNQPNTFRTYRIREGLPLLTDQELRDSLRGWAIQYGLTKNSLITDEFPENSQGTDPNIHSRMYLAHKGLFDYFKETEPNLKASDVNNYGSYGIDNLDKLFNVYPLYDNEAELLRYVTDHVHDNRNINTGTWDRIDFYASRHFEVRQANLEYYMYTGEQRYFIPYEILFAKERLSVGTQTFEGQNREVDFIVYSTANLQTLVRNESGQQIGVEEGRKQDVIQFDNGIIKAYVTHAWLEETYLTSFYGTILGRGKIDWGSLVLGNDGTKIRFSADHMVGYNSWTPTGGNEELYQSGVNGAPIRSEEGVNPYLGTVIDVSYSGWEDAREYDGYYDNLYYANYVSNRKSFTATPGNTGLYNVNGFGPLNYGQISFKKALDQRKGIALIGIGSLGKCVFYYNGFLSGHEYEDNVIVSYNGNSYNFGRVYGRQLAHAKF